MSYEIVLYILAGIFALIWLRRRILQALITNYTPREVQRKVEMKERMILLDVRTPKERKETSIKGSLHIPLQELSKRIDELKRHQDKEIVCYCATGNRSVVAANRLKKEGFKVANMKGGITEWNFVTKAL